MQPTFYEKGTVLLSFVVLSRKYAEFFFEWFGEMAGTAVSYRICDFRDGQASLRNQLGGAFQSGISYEVSRRHTDNRTHLAE